MSFLFTRRHRCAVSMCWECTGSKTVPGSPGLGHTRPPRWFVPCAAGPAPLWLGAEPRPGPSPHSQGDPGTTGGGPVRLCQPCTVLRPEPGPSSPVSSFVRETAHSRPASGQRRTAASVSAAWFSSIAFSSEESLPQSGTFGGCRWLPFAGGGGCSGCPGAQLCSRPPVRDWRLLLLGSPQIATRPPCPQLLRPGCGWEAVRGLAWASVPAARTSRSSPSCFSAQALPGLLHPSVPT